MNKNILIGIATVGGLALIAGSYLSVNEPSTSYESYDDMVREAGMDDGVYPSDDYSDKDCSDFSTQSAAQRFFMAEGGPRSDPHRLDRDDDGVVCETLP